MNTISAHAGIYFDCGFIGYVSLRVIFDGNLGMKFYYTNLLTAVIHTVNINSDREMMQI